MEIKFSQMPQASAHAVDDVFSIVQGGTSKKTTLTTLLKNLNSNDTIKINPLQNPVNTVISSKNITNLVYIDGVNDKIGLGTGVLSTHLLTIAGNVVIGNSSADGIIISSSEEIYWASGDSAKSLSLSRTNSYLSVQSGYTGVFLLAAGFDGQQKTITMSTENSGTIGCTGIGGTFSSINMSAKGNGISLVFKNSGAITGWAVVGNNGCTFS